MTVLVVLITFLAFALIDYLMTRNHVPQVAPEPKAPAKAAPFLQPAWVDGFAVPEELRYHHGHGWVYRERKNVARVGVDEFGAAVAGHIDQIALPRPGQWLRQGQKAWSIIRGDETVDMISPTEGEVVEVNREVIQNPELLRTDPYGKGWLLSVHVPDEESTTRNLLPKNLVKSWMRQCIERLYALQPGVVGATAADGGRPVGDVLSSLPAENWKSVASEFFLTKD